jgi:Family of unknown function (DUF6494)
MRETGDYGRDNGLSGGEEHGMDEDTFNMGLRKFLKVVGVTSQREIENAVHAALKAGKLSGNERLRAKATLEIEAVNLTHVVEEEIALGTPDAAGKTRPS